MKSFYIGIIFLAMIIADFGSALTVFAEDNAGGTNKKILVNIERQMLIAVEANKLVFEYDVLTGRPNKELFKWAPVGTPILILEGRAHENERLNAYK